MDQEAQGSPKQMNWSSALITGLIATVAITITMALFGQNIMKMLGSTLLGENASTVAVYLAGASMHLMVGLVWGVIYAWLFGPVRVWNPLIKGVVYGFAITAAALATMPIMMGMMGGGGAGNPCAAAANPCAAASNPCATAVNPCMKAGAVAGGTAGGAANPCADVAANPCASAAANPCNPCSSGSSASAAHAANPCNPCGAKVAAKKGAANACSAAAGNPCNPCGGSGDSPYQSMISLINHLVFAIVLALVYRPRIAG